MASRAKLPLMREFEEPICDRCRYTPEQWQTRESQLSASDVDGRRHQMMDKRYPEIAKALTKGTHWICVQPDSLMIVAKGKCVAPITPNEANVVKIVRQRCDSLDKMFALAEQCL
eukprot:TRINITY_DN8290_c0_g1_i1.p3 TRINITY_DN8290_c0_g1~~TRINITY_DN8290_c0_g1_i1.p3  ORF type:complete len:115 (+),score=17.32 TRINITY_DN8290_c0_g1_i1:725-1069(+)